VERERRRILQPDEERVAEQPSNEPTDDELLRRCQRGDDAALTELVRRFEARLFRLAFRVLQDAARAEDATVDALATVWSRCRTWSGDAGASTWIQQVGLRVVLDHHRWRKRWWRFWEHGEIEEKQTENDNPAQLLAEQESQQSLADRIAAALATLSAEDRALVHLHYFEGQSLAAIAVVLAVSRDALKMRLSRARKQLRLILGDADEPT
jgi:RNA polymerase sigma-70 factor (ECF subfamily)